MNIVLSAVRKILCLVRIALQIVSTSNIQKNTVLSSSFTRTKFYDKSDVLDTAKYRRPDIKVPVRALEILVG